MAWERASKTLEPVRSMEKTGQMRFTWDEYELDPPARRLHGPDGEVHVEPQVFDVLVHLVQNRDRVVSKAELLDSVWGDQFVSESALATRIKHVRQALGDDGRTQRYIRNVHGRGYQFVGDIADNAESTAGSASDPAPVATPAPEHQIALGASIAVDEEFPFVGRSAEIEQLNGLIDLGNHSTQIYIGGAPGYGKSRLALELLARAQSEGAITAAGRCDEHLTSALQPVRDAVAHLAQTRPQAFVGWCAGVEGPIVHLLPSTATLLQAEPVVVDGYASIDVLLAVLDQATREHALYLLVDDLHWSDEPTRALLSQLHRRLGDRPVVTVATFRSGAPDLPQVTRQWISTQRRQANGVRIDLEELDEGAAAHLAAAVLGGDADGAELLARTGGHPLFLTEAIRDRALGVESAGSVSELVTGRLDRLDDAVGSLVRTAAVYGPAFPFEVVGAAAGLDAIDALEAVDRAIEAELLHETSSPSQFRFSHQLIPEAIRQSLTRASSARTHLNLAEALEASQADAATVAWFRLGAVPLVQVEVALEGAVDAARAAIEDSEFDRAIRLLERCLASETQTRQRAELLVLLGQARVSSGNSIAAVPELDEAVALARQNSWTDIVVAVAIDRFGMSPYRDVSERVTVGLLKEALAALPEGPSADRARLLAKLAVFLASDEPLSVREAMSSEALAMVGDADPLVRLRVQEAHCIVLTCLDGIDRLTAADATLNRLLEESGYYFADAAAPETPRLWRGDGEGFRRVAEVDEVRARKQPIAEWRTLSLRSTLAAFEGDADMARQHADDAGAIGPPYWGESSIALQAFSHLFIDQVFGQAGRSAEFFSLILLASDSIRMTPSAGAAFAIAGDLDRAREMADLVLGRRDDFAWFGEYILGGNMLSGAAELGLAVDDDELCEVAEEHLLPYQDLMLGLPWGPSLAAADSLAQLAMRRGDEATAEKHWATASSLYTSLNAPNLLARLERIRSQQG